MLDQQRVLAEFGEFALRAEDLDGILSEACRLVGDALRTDLAKVAELLPDGKSMLVRAGVGWKPGVVKEVVVSSDETRLLRGRQKERAAEAALSRGSRTPKERTPR